MLGNGDAFSAYLSRYTYVRLNSLPVDLKNMFNWKSWKQGEKNFRPVARVAPEVARVKP